uniref:Uncharacterized protein n=1 Tax=Stomoxys calcitrans TaxID=35570 RepID=A0A1I8NPD7_STOCA
MATLPINLILKMASMLMLKAAVSKWVPSMRAKRLKVPLPTSHLKVCELVSVIQPMKMVIILYILTMELMLFDMPMPCLHRM